MTSSHQNKIIGYGICGPNEKYLKETLDCFKELTDKTVILCNNADPVTKATIVEYGFDLVSDDREWGLNQNKIKEDFVATLGKYDPDWLVCLDMDEVLDVKRPELEDLMTKCSSMSVYIVNLWEKGWKKKWSFWNVRVWKWNGVTKFANRPLHCGLAPEWAYHYASAVPIPLIHRGLMEKESRQAKIKRYQKYDPKAVYRDKSYYAALADDTYDEYDLEDIKSNLKKNITNIVDKKIRITKRQKFCIVESPDGRQIDIPESDLYETLKRGFKLIKEI